MDWAAEGVEDSLPWVAGRRDLSALQVVRFIDEMKNTKAWASQKHHHCKVCKRNEDNHKMCYRVFHCASSTCSSDCTWEAKILTCLKEYDTPTPPSSTTRNVSNTFQKSEHESLLRSPPRKKMKQSAKRFVKEKTNLGSMPSQIQGDLVEACCDLPVEELPSLSQIQRLSYHHRKTTLLDDALVKHMNQLIEQHQRPLQNSSATTPYTFGYKVDMDGRSAIGRGTDENPTLVGITTAALLGMLRRADTCTFHVDATFNLNQSGFPVIIFGVSDSARSFHPIAFFITSQLQAEHYQAALQELFLEFESRTGAELVIGCVMTDADDGLFNALDAVFSSRSSPRPLHLMCFFHVMINVKKHNSSLSKAEKRLVKDVIYNMHFSRDEDEFLTQWQARSSSWAASPGLKAFRVYFGKQWIDNRFRCWQCFWSPPGSAKTNNPIEQFNRQIKRDYTLGVLMAINPLFENLANARCLPVGSQSMT